MSRHFYLYFAVLHEKRRLAAVHSLQGCSQQSLQDRADRSAFIIEGFRNAVKIKITERNISSGNKNRQISHISLRKMKNDT